MRIASSSISFVMSLGFMLCVAVAPAAADKPGDPPGEPKKPASKTLDDCVGGVAVLAFQAVNQALTEQRVFLHRPSQFGKVFAPIVASAAEIEKSRALPTFSQILAAQQLQIARHLMENSEDLAKIGISGVSLEAPGLRGGLDLVKHTDLFLRYLSALQVNLSLFVGELSTAPRAADPRLGYRRANTAYYNAREKSGLDKFDGLRAKLPHAPHRIYPVELQETYLTGMKRALELDAASGSPKIPEVFSANMLGYLSLLEEVQVLQFTELRQDLFPFMSLIGWYYDVEPVAPPRAGSGRRFGGGPNLRIVP